MPTTIENGPDFWTSCALRISTTRSRLPNAMPSRDQEIIVQAQRQGWCLRDASPRWDTIWRPSAKNLATVGIVILPAKRFGMNRDERCALVLHRLLDAGFDVSTPNLRCLCAAQQKWRTAITPVWQNALSAEHHTKVR